MHGDGSVRQFRFLARDALDRICCGNRGGRPRAAHPGRSARARSRGRPGQPREAREGRQEEHGRHGAAMAGDPPLGAGRRRRAPGPFRQGAAARSNRSRCRGRRGSRARRSRRPGRSSSYRRRRRRTGRAGRGLSRARLGRVPPYPGPRGRPRSAPTRATRACSRGRHRSRTPACTGPTRAATVTIVSSAKPRPRRIRHDVDTILQNNVASANTATRMPQKAGPRAVSHTVVGAGASASAARRPARRSRGGTRM